MFGEMQLYEFTTLRLLGEKLMSWPRLLQNMLELWS